MNDIAALAKLIEAIRPWLGQLVVVGGWAHRLHRYHPLASSPPYITAVQISRRPPRHPAVSLTDGLGNAHSS
jgi:hypothetical protein